MKSSAISSAIPTLPPARQSDARHSRKAFALTGPSVVLDPTTHAVRGDLADVRLAEYVFAPHYAAPMGCVANRTVALRAARQGGDTLAELTTGENFEVLELAGDHAWGIAPERGLVGYCERAALDQTFAEMSPAT